MTEKTTRKKELLSIKDVMQITSLGRNTVYEIFHSGEFTVYKFGNKLMALEKDFYKWLYNEKKNTYVFKLKKMKGLK